MTKLVDLKRTKAEKKEEAKEYSGRPSVAGIPDYPWGLCITFNDEVVGKVFGDGLPEVGDEYEITARGKITAVRQSASEKGDDSQSVELQITSVGLSDPDEEKDARKGGSLRKTIEKAAG